MRLVQNSFVGGEISPELYGRHDIEAYFHAAKRITNFIVRGTGGLRKRQGTQIVKKIATDGASAAKPFAYIYDRTQWMYLLFYNKGESDTVYYKTVKYSPGSATTLSAEQSIPTSTLKARPVTMLHMKQLGDTIFLSNRNLRAAKGKVDYGTGTVSWEQASHATTPHKPSAFIKWDETNEVWGSGTGSNWKNGKATGFSHDDGYQTTTRTYCLVGVKNGVYSPVRQAGVRITLPWSLGATVTLKFSPRFAGDGDEDDYTKYDYYILGYRAAGSWMVLDTFYDGDQSTETIGGTTMPVCTLVDNNMVSSAVVGVTEPIEVGGGGTSEFNVDIVDVWEQRLVMASSRDRPFSIWFSRTGDVGNFHASRPQAADDAFEATMAALSAPRILHTVTGRWFLLFTNEGEYRIDSSGQGFSFATIAVRKTSNVGAHDGVEPVVSDSHVFFCAPDAKSVYALAYDLGEDNILPRNVTLLAGHMTEGRKIIAMVYVKFPEPRLLALLDSGDILCMTYLPDQKVAAWHRCHFGYDGLKCVAISCPGTILEESGAEPCSDVLLLFQKPGDMSAFWLERVRPPSHGDTQLQEAALCVDHWGYPTDSYPVAGENPLTSVEAEVVTLRPEIQDANSIGLKKNIYDCTVRLNRSGTITIAPDADGIDEASSAAQAEATPTVVGERAQGGTVALVTKDVAVLPRAYHNKNGRMVIRSADQWPCEILSVLFNIEVAREEGDQ